VDVEVRALEKGRGRPKWSPFIVSVDPVVELDMAEITLQMGQNIKFTTRFNGVVKKLSDLRCLLAQ
jgi:hypothetical protein